MDSQKKFLNIFIRCFDLGHWELNQHLSNQLIRDFLQLALRSPIIIHLSRKFRLISLLLATFLRDNDIVTSILQASDINPNATDGVGNSPLIIAAQEGYVNIIQNLNAG